MLHVLVVGTARHTPHSARAQQPAAGGSRGQHAHSAGNARGAPGARGTLRLRRFQVPNKSVCSRGRSFAQQRRRLAPCVCAAGTCAVPAAQGCVRPRGLWLVFLLVRFASCPFVPCRTCHSQSYSRHEKVAPWHYCDDSAPGARFRILLQRALSLMDAAFCTLGLCCYGFGHPE